MKRGYTMLEALIVLLFVPLILNLAVMMLQTIRIETERVPHIKQAELFEIQLQQLLLRSEIVTLTHDQIAISLENKRHTIEFDPTTQRILKTPGYEILCESVNYFSIQNTHEGVEINYESEGEARSFKIY